MRKTSITLAIACVSMTNILPFDAWAQSIGHGLAGVTSSMSPTHGARVNIDDDGATTGSGSGSSTGTGMTGSQNQPRPLVNESYIPAMIRASMRVYSQNGTPPMLTDAQSVATREREEIAREINQLASKRGNTIAFNFCSVDISASSARALMPQAQRSCIVTNVSLDNTRRLR